MIYADVKANNNVSDQTIASYIEALEKLYVVKDIDAWTPQIRSKTAIRSAKKHIFVDPSIGMAALGLAPEYFNNDLDLFGHVFENLVLRDLLVYAESCDARVMHYSDDFGIDANNYVFDFCYATSVCLVTFTNKKDGVDEIVAYYPETKKVELIPIN